MSDLLARFGKRLAELRLASGKTQEQLGLEGAAHRTYVSELERGEKDPSLTKIFELAKAVGVDPTALVDFQCEAEGPTNDASEPDLAVLLTKAVNQLRTQAGSQPMKPLRQLMTLQAADRLLVQSGLPREQVLSELARLGAKKNARTVRDALEFMIADKRPVEKLSYSHIDAAAPAFLPPHIVLAAVKESNRVLELLHEMAVANGVPIFKLLGMRNLSSFVGEILKSELCRMSENRFAPNPNQDGYPDLCALTKEGVEYFALRLRNGETSDKSFWSPFPHGGIEVKATCGNTPPARVLAKPSIGESRWPMLTSAEWKAHHRKTNNLLGIYWDFIDGLPTILAAFFRNDLSSSDWGEVIKPKTDESSTTSVSIMPKGRVGEELGVKKMAKGWVVLPKDRDIRTAITKRDVFYLEESDIWPWTSCEPE